MSNDEHTISIMGEEVAAHSDKRHIDELLFLPDNPRVYAAVREMANFNALPDDEQQHRIYQRLLKEPSVKKLIPEIKRDGGLHDPIVVRWDTKQVIEGNSRLAAYRRLNEKSPGDWTKIQCLIVGKLTHDQQTRLLGQAHLRGKTDWSSYAKALFCYRWVIEDKRDAAALHRVSGLSVKMINKYVRVIQLMSENNDEKQSHFSYYDVAVSGRKISSALQNSQTLKEELLSQIKNERFTAQELRKRLPVVIDKPKILRKFERGDINLEDAHDRAKISDTQRRLRRVRDGLDDIEKTEIEKLDHNELKAVQQILRKISRNLTRVRRMVDTKIDVNKGIGTSDGRSFNS